jgi:NADPH-dependent curcumin reductase CurA
VVGEPISSLGVGRVYKSTSNEFKEGDVVGGPLDWAEYTLFTASERKLGKLDNKYNVPWSAFTGILGMPGFTAYACVLTCKIMIEGDLNILDIQKREKPFLSRLLQGRWDKWWVNLRNLMVTFSHVGILTTGLRVLGSAGSDEKVKFLIDELEFDAAFNYKTEKPKDALPRLCPEGIGKFSRLLKLRCRYLLGKCRRGNS